MYINKFEFHYDQLDVQSGNYEVWTGEAAGRGKVICHVAWTADEKISGHLNKAQAQRVAEWIAGNLPAGILEEPGAEEQPYSDSDGYSPTYQRDMRDAGRGHLLR